ncbi:MAG: IS21 family transposase, partial [Actinomycetia bacterium]|nr:IS21 family transposase [Actinomycetes bacterium]
PVPTVASLAELNELIAVADRVDDDRVITGRPITVGAAFAAEAPTLMGLPAEAFDCARLLNARVDNRARVSVRQCFYSVPARYAGRRLPVRLAARTVEIYDGARLIARHERAGGRYIEVLCLDHYLEVLKTKPGGLPGATALAQAKARGVFTTTHQAYWDAVRRSRGDAKGTRALIAILLAHRTMAAAALITAMDRAVTSGCLDPETVIIDARRDTSPIAAVVAIGALARYDRPPPSLTDYDDLLTGSQS